MTRPLVLLIDDEPDQRTLYEEALPGFGVDAITAVSIEDAKTRLRSAVVSAIVVDLLMPGGRRETLAFIRSLKATTATRSIPVIVLTAMVTDDARTMAGTAGCDRFLTKPCLPDELAAAIHALTRASTISRHS